MTRRKTIAEWLTLAYAECEECPPPELFLQAEWDELDGAARESAMRHLEGCPACAVERDLALAFDAPPIRRPADAEDEMAELLGRVAAAGAGDQRRDGQSVLRFPSLSAVLPRGGLALAAAALILVSAGVVLRMRTAAPRLPDVPVGDVARSGRLALEAPVGDVERMPGEFDWREVEGARSYRVTLTAVDEIVLWSATASATPLRIPPEVRTALEARVVYFWYVEAFDGAGARLAWSESKSFKSAEAMELP